MKITIVGNQFYREQTEFKYNPTPEEIFYWYRGTHAGTDRNNPYAPKYGMRVTKRRYIPVDEANKIVKVPARKAIAARPISTKKVEIILCDVCTKDVDASDDYHYSSGGHQCWICCRDICRRQACFIYEKDPDDYNDSVRICIYCHPLYKKYQPDYNNLTDRHEKEIVNFYKSIIKESLAISPPA